MVAHRTSHAYTLLLRKHNALRRCASPNELLEISSNASRIEAREALRGFARVLHPDRFALDSPSIQETSHRVLQALIEAANR